MPPETADPKSDDGQRGESRFALLALPGFRDIWLAGGFIRTMRWLEVLAVSIYVFNLTGSAFMVGLMTALRSAPQLIGPWVGAVADRFNRKTLLSGMLAVMAVTSFVLGVLHELGRLEMWHIAVGAIISGILIAGEFPVRRNMMGEFAGMTRVGAAMGLDSLTNSITRLLGPFLGGALMQTLGLGSAFFLGALFYSIGFVLIIRLDYRQTIVAATQTTIFANIVDAFRYIRTNRVVLGALVVTVIANLLAFPYVSMVPVIGKDIMGLDAFHVGILASSEGFGMLAGALGVTAWAQQRFYARIFFYGAVLLCLGVIAFALMPWFAMAILVLFFAGVGVAGFAAMQGALTFSNSPPEYRARVMGVLSMCIGAGPIGILLLGAMADILGAAMAVLSIGLAGLVLLVITVAWLPELRR